MADKQPPPPVNPSPEHRRAIGIIAVIVIVVAIIVTAVQQNTAEDPTSSPYESPLATSLPTPTPTETPLAGLTLRERDYLEEMGEEEPFGDEARETLGDGWQACTGEDDYGYKGGDTSTGPEGPPTTKILRANLHDSMYAEVYEAAITHLCPKHLPLLKKEQKRLEGSFEDGDHEVGEDIEPGTYRTDGRVTDCYWERSTDGGDTIDNSFVTNAPKGVTVTIAPSDGGFSSDGCGLWLRVR